jgi:hypothetical protein
LRLGHDSQRPGAKSKTQLTKGHLQGRRRYCGEAKHAGWRAPGV